MAQFKKTNENIEMEPQFKCQKCLKFFGPEKNLYENVYKGRSLCMMCRKANGQGHFTPEEKMALFAEEGLPKRQQ